jgi:long-chain acyl-CoA synthetase
MDEEGFVYIVDRKHEMIIRGGLNVYPKEVEHVLYNHPAVFEALVIRVPHDTWGESVKAVVVLKAGVQASGQELINYCKG